MSRGAKLFEEYIRTRGLRLTKQRLQVAEIFMETDGHVSAEELYDRVRRRHPDIGFSTVYRTLKLLKEAGVARQVDFDARRAKFESSADKTHHDHLICIKCAKVVEFLEPEIERLQDEVVEKHGFVIRWHRMEIFGLCPRCRKE